MRSKFDFCLLLLCTVVVHARVSVLVLDSQRALLDGFRHQWRAVWDASAVRIVPTLLSARRGHGQCLGLLDALRMDEAEAPSNASFVFEPDALPFEGVAYDWLHTHDFRKHEVYFLGGHEIRCTPRCAIEFPWTPVSQVYGGYGMVLSAHGRRAVMTQLESYCNDTDRHMYSTDVVLSVCFDAVLATPLMVDHPSQGYSNTWGANKTWPWAGERAWWHIGETIDQPTKKRVHECA